MKHRNRSTTDSLFRNPFVCGALAAIIVASNTGVALHATLPHHGEEQATAEIIGSASADRAQMHGIAIRHDNTTV